MKEVLKRFSSIFLISLLLVKVSAFHVYEHHNTLDDTDTHCELCVLTIKSQQLDATVPSSLGINITPPVIPSESIIVSFEQKFVSSIQEGILFSRPPPYTLA